MKRLLLVFILTCSALGQGSSVTSATKDFYLEIAKGNVPGHSFIHKFGNTPDFDQADGFVNIWGLADNGGDITQLDTVYSASADIQYISSSAGGDTQTVEVQGLDTDWLLNTQTKALNGTTRVTLDTALRRVFRVKNMGATDFAGDVYVGVGAVGGSIAGVPSVASEARAIVHLGEENQTLMAVYTIPAGKTGYLCKFWFSTHGASRSGNYDLHLLARPSGGVFQLKHTSSSFEDGTSHWAHSFMVPEVFAAQTDIELKCNVIGTAVTAASASAGFDIILVDD